MPAVKRAAVAVAKPAAPTKPAKPAEAVSEPARPLVWVEDGVLTVDLGRVANLPQTDREAVTARVRRLVARFEQDPYGVIA